MALEKLKIAIETSQGQFGEPFEVMYNPNQMQMSRTGGKIDESDKKFIENEKGQRTTLTMNLFFDTTFKNTVSDVQEETKKIYSLTKNQGDLGRPPLCRIYWGSRSNNLYLQGFLSTVTKNLTKFSEDGTPLRATLDCTFIEWIPPEQEQKEQNVIDDPIRIVRRGETLSSIAAEEYSNPALWRLIADANKIYNPLDITPGQTLTVPPRP